MGVNKMTVVAKNGEVPNFLNGTVSDSQSGCILFVVPSFWQNLTIDLDTAADNNLIITILIVILMKAKFSDITLKQYTQNGVGVDPRCRLKVLL